MTPTASACLSQLRTDNPTETCSVEVSVKNLGNLVGDAVLLVFYATHGTSTAPSIDSRTGLALLPKQRQLMAFKRIADVTPDGHASMTFNFTSADFANPDEMTGNLVSQAQSHTLQFYFADQYVSLNATVTGPRTVLEYFPKDT